MNKLQLLSLTSLLALSTLAPSPRPPESSATSSKISVLQLKETPDSGTQPIRSEEKCDTAQTLIPPTRTIIKVLSELSLSLILTDIKEKFEKGQCKAHETLFAFDLDETVLVAKGTAGAKPIRSSPEIISEVQKLGVATLALTIRDAIPAEYHAYISASGKEAKKYIYGQSAFVLQDVADAGIVLKKGIEPFQAANSFYDENRTASSAGFFHFKKDGAFNIKDKEIMKDLLFYKNGIVMASHHSKGDVLQRFLSIQGQGDRFKCIFFADDELKNIDAMRAAYEHTQGRKVFLFHMPKP